MNKTLRIILLVMMLMGLVISSVYAMPIGIKNWASVNIDTPVNIRSGPSLKSEILGKFTPGVQVQVLDFDVNGWYKIKYKGKLGYVYADYIDIDTYSKYERVSTYTTYFNPDNLNRNHNITLAAKNISIKILPGQRFIWSQVIGPASKEQGYKLGNVIVGDEFVQDYGGGVCQVSTTLYNAALEAGLEIVERHTHGLPVTYVPKGKDATVSYGYLDFIFKNNKPYPIQISGFAGKGFVTVGIYKM